MRPSWSVVLTLALAGMLSAPAQSGEYVVRRTHVPASTKNFGTWQLLSTNHLGSKGLLPGLGGTLLAFEGLTTYVCTIEGGEPLDVWGLRKLRLAPFEVGQGESIRESGLALEETRAMNPWLQNFQADDPLPVGQVITIISPNDVIRARRQMAALGVTPEGSENEDDAEFYMLRIRFRRDWVEPGHHIFWSDLLHYAALWVEPLPGPSRSFDQLLETPSKP